MLDRLKHVLQSEPDLTWLATDSHELDELPQHEPAPRPPRAARRPRLEGNLPLWLGALIVLGLFIVVLFGPLLAPENPYLAGQRSSLIINGQYTTPPFPPMPGLPLGTDQWGRDILSMLLYGTRNTLVACLFIAMARVLLGATLGMLAGWNEGGLLDRAVMGLIELTTALPTLLTGMILIYALGIQRGIGIFIVALCFVGWAEIAQYIRSEFMLMRRKPFIEGARAVGQDGLGIAVRHILPNILPSLVIIAVLEMGAVLMILGELGFVGVFIGGGSWVQVGDIAVANIPDIPEWGAMMAGARAYARSQTWMVFYPALAFFLAVLGFNLLGEGLRHIVQTRGVSTAFILSKRMVLVVLAISLATAYIITHVGPAPSYASLAQRFEGESALAHVQALTAPDMQGRQAGTSGADAAAAYIAARFAEYQLDPINPQFDYRLPLTTTLVAPVTQPELTLLDANGQTLRTFAYLSDFGIDVHGHGGPGTATGPLVWLQFDKTQYDPRAFKGLDLRGCLAMCLASQMPTDWPVEAQIRGALGLLLVDDDIASRLQINAGGEYLRTPTLPILRITRATADALLQADGMSVNSLSDQSSTQDWQAQPLGQRARMSVSLSAPRVVRSDNVVALFQGSDATLNKQMIVVCARYDGSGTQPDGTLLPAANDGTSGVAVMLEILRLWRASGFQPRRSMLFAVWTGGDWEQSGAHEYLATLGQYSSAEVVAVVNLNGLGRGGSELCVRGDARLADLVLRSAESDGIVGREGATPLHAYQSAFSAPTVTVGWRDEGLLPAQDTPDQISATKLSDAGQAINLALITLAREYEY